MKSITQNYDLLFQISEYKKKRKREISEIYKENVLNILAVNHHSYGRVGSFTT